PLAQAFMVRARVDPSAPGAENLRRVEAALLEARDHGDAFGPFLRPGAFRARVNYFSLPSAFTVGPLRLTQRALGRAHTDWWDLSLYLSDDGPRTRGELVYNAALLDRAR